MDELMQMATSPIQTSAELKRSNPPKKSPRSGSPRASQASEFKSRLDSYRKEKTPPKGVPSPRTNGLARTASTRNARSVSPRSKVSGPSARNGPLISRVSSKGSMRSPSTPITRKGGTSALQDDFENDLSIEVILTDEDKELDVAKLTEIYNATLNRYGTKDLKKRSFAVLMKKVCVCFFTCILEILS